MSQEQRPYSGENGADNLTPAEKELHNLRWSIIAGLTSDYAVTLETDAGKYFPQRRIHERFIAFALSAKNEENSEKEDAPYRVALELEGHQSGLLLQPIDEVDIKEQDEPDKVAPQPTWPDRIIVSYLDKKAGDSLICSLILPNPDDNRPNFSFSSGYISDKLEDRDTRFITPVHIAFQAYPSTGYNQPTLRTQLQQVTHVLQNGTVDFEAIHRYVKYRESTQTAKTVTNSNELRKTAPYLADIAKYVSGAILLSQDFYDF